MARPESTAVRRYVWRPRVRLGCFKALTGQAVLALCCGRNWTTLAPAILDKASAMA
jgi:hypothetical protein